MTTTTLTRETTADILAKMMTENTGRSFLDSGGANGRAWQRNAGMTAEDFEARPAVTIDADFGAIELDLFHFLNERLTYVPVLTAEWMAFDAERPDESYRETLDEWLDGLGVDPNPYADFYSDGRWEFNTYNFEGCLLNGTIQGVKFVHAGTEYLALQIHGGADVRGGYTAYKIFAGDVESVIIDSTRATLHCGECDFYADFSDGVLQDVYLGDSPSDPSMLIEMAVPTQVPDSWEITDGCPLHGGMLI